MAAGKKKPEENGPASPGIRRSLRAAAEEHLARSPKVSPDLTGQTPEELIHELQVHQVELETQAEELRRAHLALTESRDKYLDLFEFAPLGYFTLNDRGLITEVNLTGAVLLAAERSNLVHAPLSNFFAEKERDQWHRDFVDVVKKGEKLACNPTLVRGDGSSFPARMEAVRISDRSDGMITVRVAIGDITDIRNVEEGLSLAKKKLELLTSITRHDINNQLMTLNGFLELLHKKVPDPDLCDYFSRIEKAIFRISSMIQFTKEYEQIGINAPAWQNCRILVDTIAKEAPLGKVRIKNDLPAGTGVFADPLVARVFYNLMDNAVRYGGKITTIRFSVDEREGNQVIVCEDDGIGIPADEKEKIFERGFGKNSGLGLAISREVLSITGITIKETGGPGTGARFEMTVPVGMFQHRTPGDLP
ncbi:MAG: PAS domain-containing sensor histidine kinase [Methanomicrobiales archaeon]